MVNGPGQYLSWLPAFRDAWIQLSLARQQADLSDGSGDLIDVGTVPGGVGLLTVDSLAFNVLKSYQIQRNQSTYKLEIEFLHRAHLKEFISMQETKSKIMLLSSAYNGLTQKIDKSLINLGY